MSEFDIRIGTLLDTSKAEAQLQEFINKYNEGDTINLKLRIDDDGKSLTELEKSIKTIIKLAKSIENIKLDINTDDLTKAESNIGDTIKKNATELGQATQEVRKEINDSMKNNLDDFDNQLGNIKKKLGNTLDELQQMKLDPNANIGEINKLQDKLKEIANIDFDKFGKLGLQLVNEEINEVIGKFSELYTMARNNQLNNAFQDVKVKPLMNQLEAVKEILDFRGLDTSGIDRLINKLKETSKYATDLRKASSIVREVSGEFGNMKSNLKMNDIKSSETAIKKLLEYKEQLLEEIRFSVDSSKIEDAHEIIKRIDESIDRLRQNSDESLVKNLIDISELNDMQNMENAIEKFKANAEKMEKTFDGLKNKFKQLSETEYVDLSSIKMVESYIEGVEQSIKSLDFDNIKAKDLKLIADDLQTLDRCLIEIKRNADEVELKVNFDNELSKATSELNGLHAALIKVGGDTSVIEELGKDLKAIDKYATQDLKQASAALKEFRNGFKDMGKGLNLGDISGEMSQFTKYVNEIQKAMKQLATTKDVNFAKTIKEQISETMKALDKLTDGFDDVQKQFAKGFLDDAIKGMGQGISQEVQKINAEAEKLRVVLYRISTMELSENVGKGIAEEFEKATDKVSELQSALRRAMNNSDFKAEGIIELRQELEQAQQAVVQLGKKKIELDCQEAIARAERLKDEVEDLDSVLSKLGGVDAISKINEDFQNGAMSFDKATAALKKFESAMDKVESSSVNVGKSFDAFDSIGNKIEGTFQNIGDAFRRFTVGELLEEGIENAIYGIKETIMGLDAAMTELRRVAPEGISFDDTGYKQIASDARQIAIDVGQSTEDVIKGMSTALQAGATTMQQASAIAQSSALLQNVSDMSAEKASQAISSLVNQYYSMGTALSTTQDKIKNAPKDYNNLTNAIDMINYAGNNFAISTEGVADALQNGGAVLSNYGVTLSDSIAMISGANESLQDPSRIGNGLRSLAINFAGLKTNAKDGTIEMNKTAKALREIAGIDIFTDSSKTSVKDMMTIMDELYEKWGSLTEAQQLGLSEGLAGKTQAAVFQSLMSGWERVNQFRQEYKDGMMIGSAEKENAAYLDSIQGKWNQLKESMKALVTNNVTQSFIKGLLDGATKVVQVIDKIMSSLGTIGTGGALVGLMTLIKGLGSFSKFSGFGLIAKSVASLFSIFTGGASATTAATSAITSGMTGMASASGLAKLGMIGLNAALTAIGWAAVVAGIVMVVKALDNYIVTTKEAISAAKEKQQSARDEISSLNSQKSSLSKIAQEYDTLAKKTNKTAEEMDRFRELKHQIAEISPDLVAGYDSNNDPILKLNGSLSSYIGELDVAIEKQRQLFLEGQAEEADARLKDNEKKSQSRDATHKSAYDLINNDRTDLSKANATNWLGVNQVANEAKTAKEMAEIRKKYRDNEAKQNKEWLSKLSKERATINENDIAIQSKYMSEFLENTKLPEGNKSMFSGFMEDLNWGTLGEEQADTLSAGLEKLASKTAFTTSEMKGFESQINAAKTQFKDTNAINAYGKSLQKIAEDSKQFDLQSWSGYIDEVNQRFANGALDMNQYKYSMGILAETIADMSGIDKGIVLESLIQTGDVESALKVATDGLNNFMSAYGKSVNDLKNGDTMAIQLEKQFKAITDLGKQMETKAIEGKFTADFVLEAAKDTDLPSQMRDIMNAFARDGEVTEIEQKVLMNIQAEIQDKGKLTGETLREVEDLLNGNFDNLKVDGKIMFNGLELTTEQAEELQSALEKAGLTAEKIKMGDTGLEDALKQAEQYQKAIEKINNVEIRTAIDSNGLIDTAKEVDNVVKALETVPKEQQVQFISDTAQYFDGAESVEAAIKSMPDIVKLKYNIGVEGDTKLEGIQEKIKALPEQIRTEVYAETYSLAEVDKLTQMVTEFGETNAVALLTLEGAGQVMHEATSTKEMLQGFQDVVYSSTLETTVKDELLKMLQKELEELEGEKTETTVEVKTEGTKEAKEEVKQVTSEVKNASEEKVEIDADVNDEAFKQKMKQINDDVESTKTGEKIEIDADVNDETFKQKMKQVHDEFAETDNKTATMNVEVEGAEESKEKTEEVANKGEEIDGSTYSADIEVDNSLARKSILEAQQAKDNFAKDVKGNITVNISGKEQLAVAINEKGELEKDGTSVTNISLNGSEKLSVAINDKGQLEVNGVARTDIQLDGAEELKFAINDKGELEVNGQAVTDIKVNGKGELEDAKGTLDNLEEEKSINVSFNVNDALDSIMSRLGLSKQKEEIIITVTCKDNASTTLDKINTYKDKNIKITITCTGGDTVSSQVQTIANTNIANKQFSITANASAATTTVSTLANKQIPAKTFTISCMDSASSKINALANKQIANKTFSVTCNDGATSTVSRIANQKISDKKFSVTTNVENAMSRLRTIMNATIKNKSFTIKCNDNASGTLSSIQSRLRNINSKTITVTARYSQVGRPPKGVSASEPQIVDTETPIIVNNTANVSALADTQSNIASVRNAMASVQASYTDTINSNYSWVNNSLEYDIDLLQDFNAQLEKVNNNLDLVSKQAENAFGNAKAKLLEKQISLLQQQQGMLKHEQNELKTIQANLKSSLSNQGFRIDGNGAVTNYANQLLSLEKAVENAKKAQDAYTGDNKNKQKQLQNAYDKANDKLTKAKDTLSEYYDTSNKIGDLSNEWEDIKQSIEDAKNEITKAKIEQQMFSKELKTQKLENQYDVLVDKLEILQSKIDLETNEERKIELLKEQSKLIDQQQAKLKETEKSYKSQADIYRSFLSQKGFNFDENGNADPTRLTSLVNAADYEAIKEVYDLYIELQRDTIPGLQQEWYDLEKEQQNAKESINDINEELKETAKELKELNKMKAFDFLDELTNKQEKLSQQMDLLEAKMELTYGSRNKEQMLKQQINLIEQQKNAVINTNKELEKQQKYLQNDMKLDGFKFDASGNISNLDSILNKAKTQEQYEELKEKAEEYYDIQEQIMDGTIEWYEYQQQIEETKNEIEELKDELKELKSEAKLTELSNEVTHLANEFERLENLQALSGQDTLMILTQQLNLIEQQKNATQNLIEFRKSQVAQMQKELNSYGFGFDEEGLVTNASSVIEKLKDTLSEDEFEKVNASLEEYFEISLDEISGLENDLLDFQKTYEDILQQKLDATKKIEDEITKIYEKQIEERIEKIEEERDAQVEALNKSKEAYQKWRDEVNYEDDYNEQLKKVQELQAKIEIAQRDDSLSGKKRLEDLMSQLNEEQKNLEDLVQDKIDQDINEMFDDQINRIEENTDKQIESLENTFTETKIAEMVANAIKTGVFEDIEGNVVSLDQALLDFANNSADYLGVMGDSLKTELLDNLGIALDTMQQLNEINRQLGNNSYQKIEYSIPLDMSASSLNSKLANLQNSNNSVSLGDMTITIQGNATPETVEDIKQLLEEQREKMIHEIMVNVK